MSSRAEAWGWTKPPLSDNQSAATWSRCAQVLGSGELSRPLRMVIDRHLDTHDWAPALIRKG